jgi:hypothetical protein
LTTGQKKGVKPLSWRGRALCLPHTEKSFQQNGARAGRGQPLSEKLLPPSLEMNHSHLSPAFSFGIMNGKRGQARNVVKTS